MPKQQTLDVVKDKKNPHLTKLAEEYVAVRDERMALTRAEVEKRSVLEIKMGELKLERYEDPDSGIVVTVENKTKVKVKKPGSDDPDDPGVED